MYLDIRRKNFEKLISKIKCNEINDLMVEVPIDEKLFQNLRTYTMIFMSKSFNENFILTDEKLLLENISLNHEKLKNMTPNGMMVPKRELALDFNNLLKSYVDILKSINVYDLIENFHFPPNIRLKLSETNKDNLSRAHPTEMMHSDTWTGANFNWIASHIYILGDIKNNHILYGYPPENFDESWLFPIENASLGQKYSEQFKNISYIPKPGTFILADATVFHRSFTNNNCGLRVSLDTGFDMIAPNIKKFKNRSVGNTNVGSIRDNETIKKQDFWNIGLETFYSFPNKFHDEVDSKGGFKHPSAAKKIELI